MTAVRLRGLVFDVDGVLLDSWGLMQHAMRHAHASCGAQGEVPVEAFRRQLGRPLPEIAEALGLPPSFVEAYQAMSRANVSMSSLYDGVPETLDELRARGLKLALNTSKDRVRTEEMLSRFGIAQHFTAVITANDVAQGKPHPESLRKAAQALGLEPVEIAFLGDSPIDIQCAHAAEVLPIAAAWGMSTPEELRAAGAQLMISRIHDLTTLLGHLENGGNLRVYEKRSN